MLTGISRERGSSLVRISPFDASGRRHTSLIGGCHPTDDDGIAIERLTCARYLSGHSAGSACVKTDSLYHHIPTGIVVSVRKDLNMPTEAPCAAGLGCWNKAVGASHDGRARGRQRARSLGSQIVPMFSALTHGSGPSHRIRNRQCTSCHGW